MRLCELSSIGEGAVATSEVIFRKVGDVGNELETISVFEEEGTVALITLFK